MGKRKKRRRKKAHIEASQPSRSPEPPEASPQRPAPSREATTRPWVWVYVCVIALVTVAAYANSFGVPFVLDDRLRIEREEVIRPPVSLGALISYPGGRPIVMASLAFNYAIGELDVTSYHVLNLVLHLACGLLLFGFTRYTLRLPVLAERFKRHANGLALFTTAVFLLHPVQTESVTYISQRGEILVAGG